MTNTENTMTTFDLARLLAWVQSHGYASHIEDGAVVIDLPVAFSDEVITERARTLREARDILGY